MEATAPQNVFVTGANGAAGLEIAARLARAGHHVTGAVTTSSDAAVLRKAGILPAFPGERAGELRSALQAAQASVLIHAAPLLPNTPLAASGAWDAAQTLLADGTVSLIEAAAGAGVNYIIHLSYAFLDGAGAAHSSSGHGEVVRVDDLPLAKAARNAEREILNSALPACVLRTGYIYHAHSPEMLSLRDALRGGRALTLGDGHYTAAWLHAADLAEAVLLALDKRPAGVVLTLADDQPASLKDFAEHLSTNMGLPLPGQPPGFLRALRPDKTRDALLAVSTHASSAAAREVLSWSPRYRTFREGLDQALLEWRADTLVK